jgi:PPM family protein phosphatase
VNFGVNFEIFSATDQGLVRSENQDSFLVYKADDGEVLGRKGFLAIVADGVGGQIGGKKASETAVEIIREHYIKASADSLSSLTQAIEVANSSIYTLSAKNEQFRGMATTCTALAVRDEHAFIAHVGDSRAYLYRNGELSQITNDHTLVESLVREGLITREQARNHPRRNVILRALGSKGTVDVDTHIVDLMPNDIMLLCSDGLYNMVSHENISSILASFPVEEGGLRMMETAKQAGGFDNITIIIMRMLSVRERSFVTKTKAY